jgi:hypothetical protein
MLQEHAAPGLQRDFVNLLRDGDQGSERVGTGESDRKCTRWAAERTRSPPPAATEQALGTAHQTRVSDRFLRLGPAREWQAPHAVGRFCSPKAVDLEVGPRQVPGLQRFPYGGKRLRAKEGLSLSRETVRRILQAAQRASPRWATFAWSHLT